MKQKNHTLTKGFLSIFIPSALFIAGLLVFVYVTESASEREIIKRTESSNVQMLKQIVAADLHTAVSDLLILASHSGLKSLLDGDKGQLEAAANDFLTFSLRKGAYDQIRYLDENGMEVLRVNYNKGQPYVVPREKLQNKGKRYYFLDAFRLSPGEVFVSPLDLNIERGQIEQPLKPMIRLGTPVTDSSGNKRGIVLLNYFGQRIIDSISRAHQGLGEILLLNADGYFLKGLNPSDEWGFMYEDRRDLNFAKRFPPVSTPLNDLDTGVLTNEAGMFTFERIHPVTEADRTSSGSDKAYEPSQHSLDAKEYVWTLVGYVPESILAAGLNRFTLMLIQLYSLLLVVAAIGAWLLAKAKKSNIDAHLALKQSAEELKRSNRELEEFAYIASHDLQEPLRKVMVFGERLETKYQEVLDDRGRDYIRRMRSAAGRMQVLINDLLDYSRITTKAQPFSKTDLSDIVNEVLVDLETRTTELQAQIEVETLPVIEADPLQMRQLFQNLIGNALKFHRSNSVPVVKVKAREAVGESLSSKRTGKLQEIIVEDNGIGFDKEYAERIFGTFQRLHGRNEYEGTGIGLSVCRKIVNRHGGSITAESKADHGARFTIRLAEKQLEEVDRAA